MSLQNLARQIQAKGRGEDKMLVHMTPGEVQSLQALALANGGSLTINPETGLPEALSLKSILPTVVGAGLAATGVGMPFAIAAGAGTGLLTSGGNLQAGIMGGLGAWGGASLVGSLMGAGAGALGAAAAPAAELAGTEALMATGFTPTTASMAPAQVSELVSKGVLDQTAASAYGNAYSSAFPTSTAGSIQEGFKQAAASPGQFFKQNMFPIGAAVLPTLLSSDQPSSTIGAAPDQGQIRPYTYNQKRNPNYGLPGEPYFTQSYTAGTPYAAKEGGLLSLASGGVASGPVERMSMNDRKPGMYPQGMITSTQYATPSQMPASMEVVKSDYDVGVNPITGLQDRNMASGGIVALAEGGQPPAPIPPTTPTKTGVDMLQLAPNLQQYGRPAPAQNPAVAEYNQLLADRAANEYITQAPLLPMLPGGGERANLADTKKLINEYYLSELGRQADPEGLDFWANAKMNTGQTLADIKKHITDSPEGRVFDIYRDVLGRRPDEGGGAYWTQAIASGADPAKIRQEIERSPEALAKNPEYKAYLEAPITEANFDAAAYLAANPDVARPGAWAGTPYQHYVYATSKGENRVATKKPFQPTAADPTRTGGTGGYTYDQKTGKFTKTTPTSTASIDDGGFLSSALSRFQEDPGFVDYLYRQYQGSQQSYGGGKAGGLMPNALKLNMGGGISDLGGYSDGGRLLKGPGDGVSDSIPAQIGNKQPARLADGEFVIPARIVSELGNGSTDAGARKLYAMMDRVQKKRANTVGKGKVAVNSRADRVLPA